jgi:hypothetical protein
MSWAAQSAPASLNMYLLFIDANPFNLLHVLQVPNGLVLWQQFLWKCCEQTLLMQWFVYKGWALFPIPHFGKEKKFMLVPRCNRHRKWEAEEDLWFVANMFEALVFAVIQMTGSALDQFLPGWVSFQPSDWFE